MLDDHRHRHRRSPGAARRFHRAVEERGRRHGLHCRARRVGQAVRREAQGRDARRAARSPTRRRRPRRARTGAGRRRPRTRTRACSGTEGETGSERVGEQERRCSRSASTSTRKRPATTVIGPDDVDAGSRRQDRGALHRGHGLLQRALHVQGDRREGRCRPQRPRTGRPPSTTSARSISPRPTIASLCEDKYAADDAFRSSSSTRRSGRAATGARSPTSSTPATASARRATTGFGDNRRAYGASSDARTGASGVAALDGAVVGAEVGRDDARVRAHRLGCALDDDAARLRGSRCGR